MSNPEYPIHLLGWKAFQDLCVAIVEERIKKPVQTFLPTGDAGRDGAFIGAWDGFELKESTIQCKFTSKPESNLTLSMLDDELPKAKTLAEKGFADEYIILTNHTITGKTELKIREAFQAEGVKRCRVFHRDWIVEQIRRSPALRMMVPRLYGFGNLFQIFDQRAYEQTKLILSEMGDSLQKLVVTESHRKSVRAITEHNLVLLLGAPAAGKSTIGASLAIGAVDVWNCATIKSTSPEHLQQHINVDGGQFFWIDDAWGSTQYQRNRTEAWNQVFPLIQAAIKKGSKFLFTSRDYIWQSAKNELKTHALPILMKSQVVINVHEISTAEKARILYNHIKLGDQSNIFKSRSKEFLPEIALLDEFLPESARRFGNHIFTEQISYNRDAIMNFFKKPKEFLENTINGLDSSSKAAIALIFLNGGIVRSPVPSEALEGPAKIFGTEIYKVRSGLESLKGSLLNLIQDIEGPLWTYRHPTISDSFAAYVAKSPELIEVYLKGAKPEAIVREVVCAGIELFGATVIVPNMLLNELAERLANLPSHTLASFISHRSNSSLSDKLLKLRPDLWDRFKFFSHPLADDMDVDFLTTLHKQNLLPEDLRTSFVTEVAKSATESADDSFLRHEGIAQLLAPDEKDKILTSVKDNVLNEIEKHFERVQSDWNPDYNPLDHFDELQSSLENFINELKMEVDVESLNLVISSKLLTSIQDMEAKYQPPDISAPLQQQSASIPEEFIELFRDIDE